jgi:hypothetical protein
MTLGGEGEPFPVIPSGLPKRRTPDAADGITGAYWLLDEIALAQKYVKEVAAPRTDIDLKAGNSRPP